MGHRKENLGGGKKNVYIRKYKIGNKIIYLRKLCLSPARGLSLSRKGWRQSGRKLRTSYCDVSSAATPLQPRCLSFIDEESLAEVRNAFRLIAGRQTHVAHCCFWLSPSGPAVTCRVESSSHAGMGSPAGSLRFMSTPVSFLLE